MTNSANSSENDFALWQECFGDDEETVKTFSSIPDIQHLHFVSNGQTVGMAHIVPVSMDDLRGGYLYGIGVKKEYRGRGICRALLEAAEHTNCDFLCLIPANEELAETYRRYGYVKRVVRYGYPHRMDACALTCDSEAFLAYANTDVSTFGQKYGLMKFLAPHKTARQVYFESPMGEA